MRADKFSRLFWLEFPGDGSVSTGEPAGVAFGLSRRCATLSLAGLEAAMDLQVEHVAGAAIARPIGRIDGVTAPRVQSDLLELVGSAAKVVMDCAAVAYVSSAGLRAVLVAAKAAKAVGTDFSLCSVDGPLREIFMVSGFDAIIDLHDGVEAALA